MIRFLFRSIGLWLIAGAFVALVIDGTGSISASRFVFFPVESAWKLLNADSLLMLQKQLGQGLAGQTLEALLAMPLFALLAVLGVLFLLIGRRKPDRVIGYSSRD